jgi:hypothetical protein
MQGAPRRQVRSSARSVFLLPLVLALLALVAFPVFAHAGPIPEYEVEPETELPGSTTSVKPKEQKGHKTGPETDPAAHGSGAETEKNPESESEPSSEEEESESSKQGGAPGGSESNGGGKPQGGGEKPHSQKPQSESKVGPSEKVVNNTSAKPASSSDSGSGSSPVVPILIAVAVLAAISIGVVLYRQRGDDSGPGGADRRVSSPNAS